MSWYAHSTCQHEQSLASHLTLIQDWSVIKCSHATQSSYTQLMGCNVYIGVYLHGFEKLILPDIIKRSSPGGR